MRYQYSIQLVTTISFLTFILCQGFAQVQFQIASQEYNGGITTKSFYPKFFADANGDYRDDIMNLHRGEFLHVVSYCQEDANLYFRKSKQLSDSKEWTTGVIDINNDGDCEFYSSGFYSRTKIYSATSDTFDYEETQRLNTSIFAQGSSVVDINNDGFVDLFVCHDDAESHIFMNDGQGSLIKDNNIMDMETIPVSDNSGNYGVVWFDIDMDDDLDCYISKCRGGVVDPADPRRINALFINDGNHQFTEQATAFNLDDGSQSWAADFADFDNDGDFDIYIANHEAPHKLMINIDNQYFESYPIKNDEGEDIFAASYQSVCSDFDNDGWVDIMIAGAGRDAILWNKGDLAFTYEAKPFVDNAVAAGVGDINQDGFIDFSVSFQNSSLNGDKVDRIYINESNENNYIKLSFQGTVSNRQGSGALVYCHSAQGTQVNQLRAGTSYSAFNSLNMHFGLGSDTSIDSLIIKWPAGITDRYYDLNVNEHLLAVEHQLIHKLPSIFSESLVICEDQEIIIEADETISWNTGQTANQIMVTEPGVYYGFLNIDGYHFPTNKVIIKPNQAINQVIELNTKNDLLLCEGQTFVLNNSIGDELNWSEGSTGQSIEIETSGSYFGSILNECNLLIESDTIQIEFVEVNGESIDETIPESMEHELILDKENAYWYSDEQGSNLLAEGSSFLADITSDTVFYFKHFFEAENHPVTIEPLIDSALEDPAIPEFFNIGLLCSVKQTKTIRSFKTQAVVAGERDFILMDVFGDTLAKQTVAFEENEIKEVNLDWVLNPGIQYTLSTDEEKNMEEFGLTSPMLLATKLDKNYPLQEEDFVIIGPTLTEFYPYFFDLKVAFAFEDCESELYEYNVSIVSSTHGFDNTSKISFYPNPGQDQVRIEPFNYAAESTLEILDMNGKQIQLQKLKGGTVDVSSLPKGVYIFKLYENNEYLGAYKWIKY